jgi:hypothetical protein
MFARSVTVPEVNSFFAGSINVAVKSIGLHYARGRVADKILDVPPTTNNQNQDERGNGDDQDHLQRLHSLLVGVKVSHFYTKVMLEIHWNSQA